MGKQKRNCKGEYVTVDAVFLLMSPAEVQQVKLDFQQFLVQKNPTSEQFSSEESYLLE